jgi:hypothetical protein
MFCISNTFSQDKLLLLTGKMYSGIITEVSSSFIKIKTKGIHLGAIKQIYIEELYLFVKNNNKSILYKTDPIKKDIILSDDQIYYSFYEYGYKISAKDKKIKFQ